MPLGRLAGSAIARGVKKGAAIGVGAALANRVMGPSPREQFIQQQNMQHQQPPQPPPPPQPGFFDRLAGSAENMMNSASRHIENASVGACSYCGTQLKVEDRICASCGGTMDD
jgi:hypothetical protein